MRDIEENEQPKETQSLLWLAYAILKRPEIKNNVLWLHVWREEYH